MYEHVVATIHVHVNYLRPILDLCTFCILIVFRTVLYMYIINRAIMLCSAISAVRSILSLVQNINENNKKSFLVVLIIFEVEMQTQRLKSGAWTINTDNKNNNKKKT